MADPPKRRHPARLADIEEHVRLTIEYEFRRLKADHLDGRDLRTCYCEGLRKIANILYPTAEALDEAAIDHLVELTFEAANSVELRPLDLAPSGFIAAMMEANNHLLRTSNPFDEPTPGRREVFGGKDVYEGTQKAFKQRLLSEIERLRADILRRRVSGKSAQSTNPENRARTADAGEVSGGTPNVHPLTESQRKRLDEAERNVREALRAHESMRAIVFHSGWVSGPVESALPAGEWVWEVQKLERDIRNYAIVVVKVLAEVSWSLGSVDPFRAQLETDSRNILDWAIAQVNVQDLPMLDKASIERAVGQEVSNWILRARREFPPPWLNPVSAPVAVKPAPPEAEASAAPETAPDQIAVTPAKDIQGGSMPKRDVYVTLLELILEKRQITLETWAKDHRFGRTTVFDWKSLRNDGKSLKGKVSPEKCADIEEAVAKDAEALGLRTRTRSD